MTPDPDLLRLLGYLERRRYEFVCVTPATHARVLARPFDGAPDLRDVFGWNRPFDPGGLDPELIAIMRAADCLVPDEGRFRSALRVATLGRDLFLHSAFPTDDADAVFFGPDTYRFARFVAAHLPERAPARIVDLGAGSGAGGIRAARLAPSASIALVDTNPAALRLAAANARAAGVEVELVHGSRVPAGADLVLANPPYMMDEGNRAYRHGGGTLGGEVALAWARDALGALAPGGTLLLYTGVAFVDGRAPLLRELERVAAGAGASLAVEELDPDVFGEELETPAYAEVERLAAMGIVLRSAR